jgi:uncharacterized lipoprotein YajG
MKKLFTLVAVFSLVCVGLLTGCQKSETPSNTTPATPSTNAPAQ